MGGGFGATNDSLRGRFRDERKDILEALDSASKGFRTSSTPTSSTKSCAGTGAEVGAGRGGGGTEFLARIALVPTFWCMPDELALCEESDPDILL